MELGLRGRTAFVAAASGGIGRGVALAFAAEGCDVGLCARNGEALETVAMQVREAGVRAVPTVADVTDAAAFTRRCSAPSTPPADSTRSWSTRADRRRGASWTLTTSSGSRRTSSPC